MVDIPHQFSGTIQEAELQLLLGLPEQKQPVLPQFDQIGIGGACRLAVFKGRYPTEFCGGLGDILRRGAGDKDVPDASEGDFLVLRL